MPAALAQHHAVAPLREREHAVRREQAGCLPRLHRAVGVRRLGRADDGDVHLPMADEIATELDGMPSRRARAASAERRTLDAPLDADVRGGGRADVAHQRQRVGRRLLELEDVAIGDFQVGDAGLGRADDAGRPICLRQRVGEPRLRERLVGGGRREQGVAVGEQDELVALEVAQPGLVVEVRDLRGDADAEIEIRDVGGHLQEVGIVLKEALDRRNGRPAFFHARPELGDRLADRRYDAHSGDDDASTCSHVSHPETASCATLPFESAQVAE